MSFWHGKVKPFFKALFPRSFKDEDEEFIRQALNKQEQILFYRMQYLDQRHALDTAYKLKELMGRRMKINQDKMYIAALLHDVGKLKFPLKLLDRVIQSLFFSFVKPLANWLAEKGEKKNARRLYQVLYQAKHHPQIGAKIIREIGVDENIAYLVEHHQDEPSATEPIELTLLREADKYS